MQANRSIPQISRELSVPQRTLRRWVENRQIPARRHRTGWSVRAESVLGSPAFLQYAAAELRRTGVRSIAGVPLW
jgi:hypothetical protein